MTRLGPPAETAISLYTVQKEFEERRVVNRDEAVQAMTKLQQGASARVATVLGGNVTAIEG